MLVEIQTEVIELRTRALTTRSVNSEYICCCLKDPWSAIYKNVKVLPQPTEGRGGGGEVVSVIAFNSDGPSSNPDEVYIFSVKF